jgi:dolichol-phosphate mannosyltransferase
MAAAQTLAKFPSQHDYDVIVHDDGSTDGTLDQVMAMGFPVIRAETNGGIGASVKRFLHYAKEHGYEVVVLMAGNNKDDPAEIPRLLQPILGEGYDYVQGSRYLPGGCARNLPLFRQIMVRIHALIYRVLTGFPCTDALNGFRAYKISVVFNDPRINVWQGWLDRYEYESYLHYKVLKLGYKVKEVPVTKSYQHFRPGMKYSHIRPVVDWWNIMRPLVYLVLGLRK